MKLQGTGQQHAFMAQQNTSFKHSEKGGVNVSIKQQVAARIEVTSGEKTQQANHTQTKGKGVVGLLQEGHFKGVADIRLRMNFHAQIESLNAAKVSNVLETKSSMLTAGLGDQLKDIGEGFDLASEMEDLFSAFSSAIQDMFGGSEGGQPEPASIFAEIQDAFSSMFSSLQQLTPTVVSEPLDVTPEVDDSLVGVVAAEEMPEAPEASAASDAVETDSEETMEELLAEPTLTSAGTTGEGYAESVDMAAMFNEALSGLQDWFTSQMDAMQMAVDEVSVLPSLSEPRGGGVAYGKFYAMYSEMNEMSIGNTDNGTEDTSVETEV